jgi:hypothetical protein
LFILASLFAFTAAQAQVPFSIGAPKAGTALVPGQNFVVQIIEPINTSAEAIEVEVSIVIGIVPCGTSGCPQPSVDLGEILFIGNYSSQGRNDSGLYTFENFTFVVPSDISGAASIQVQHNFLFDLPFLPQGPDSEPEVEYASLAVTIGTSGPSGTSTVHPNGNSNKCVGILGGTYANGTAVDIFDCNESATQNWKFNGDALVSVNPVDQSKWCLDAGVQSLWANGVKMKIWQCFSNLPQQTWTPITTSGTIKLPSGNFCLDLTNGNLTDRNVLQIWTCTAGDANQIWTVTSS